jgi:hypothetical protein
VAIPGQEIQKPINDRKIIESPKPAIDTAIIDGEEKRRGG